MRPFVREDSSGMSTGGKLLFQRYIGIDYSGAEVAVSSLKGLRVYEATVSSDPVEVPPPLSRDTQIPALRGHPFSRRCTHSIVTEQK